MDIVGAFACSHAGFLISDFDRADPKARDTVYEGFSRMRDEIQRAKPDALVVVATDHGRIYPLNHQPQFVLGVSARARGIGDAGLPTCEVPIHQKLAQQILEGCIEAGVDLAYSEDVSIDHSFVTPLMLTTPDLDVPIVPLVQNTRMPPMPTLQRSYKVGEVLGQVLRTASGGKVAILGTGGLSHWVGDEPRRNFLQQPAGTRFVHEWSNERLVEVGGNGAQEIRNWLLVAGVAQDAPLEVLAYAAVPEWHTGSAVAKFCL